MSLLLTPQPRSLVLDGGTLVLPQRGQIALDAPDAMLLTQAAQRLLTTLHNWSLASAPFAAAEIRLQLVPGQHHAQGYGLAITSDGVLIEASDAAGVFYGVCTLIQLLDQTKGALPLLHIADWPDFAARGILLDISRDKVPTLQTLFALVDLLAGLKINQLQLYTEHTFAYRNHPTVWADASPLTGPEIAQLDAYCRARYVELVPNQSCLGHMARWLTKPGYAALAETHDQFETPWGAPLRGPWSLCPADPGSLALVRELLNELLPHFSSRLVNINCDEPVDVGQGRSRALVAERGLGRVYLDWVRDVVAVVQAHGRKAQVWSDIIVEHPELVGQLPPDTTVLVWGYEADHPFAAQCALFGQADIPFYVCPGTSSWRSIAGRTHNALANTRTAAEQGLRHAAIGYLLTDWGDCGHWQQLPVSYLPFTAAAAYSWCLATNGELDVAAATSRWALRDETGVLGRLAYTLGDLYRLQGDTTHNGTAPFAVLQQPLDAPLAPTVRVADNAMIARALDALDAALNELPRARPRGPDAALLCDEWAQTGRMLRHALHRTQLRMVPDTPQAQALRRGLAHDMADLIDEQQRLWLARNRPGGLNDSLAPLKRALHEYQREVML